MITCPDCRRSFPSGTALGGHRRSHGATPPNLRRNLSQARYAITVALRDGRAEVVRRRRLAFLRAHRAVWEHERGVG